MRVFSDLDTASLRGVYILAMESLRPSHHLDEAVLNCLADAVLQAYAVADKPVFPLSSTELETLVANSLRIVRRDHCEVLVTKH